MKTLQVVFDGLRPTHVFLGALWARLKSKRHSVFFVKIPLKVHVGVGWSKITLHGDEEQWNVHRAKALFEVKISGFRASLDVFEECILDIIHVALSSSFGDGIPGSLSLDDLNVAAIDLAWVLADRDSVA